MKFNQSLAEALNSAWDNLLDAEGFIPEGPNTDLFRKQLLSIRCLVSHLEASVTILFPTNNQ